MYLHKFSCILSGCHYIQKKIDIFIIVSSGKVSKWPIACLYNLLTGDVHEMITYYECINLPIPISCCYTGVTCFNLIKFNNWSSLCFVIIQ